MNVLFLLLLALFLSTSPLRASQEAAITTDIPVDSETKILGGVESKLGDWPWIAALLHSGESDLYQAQYCSGVLIDDYWVLTAAHCVYNMSINDVEVAVGVFDLTTFSGSRLPVKNFRIHPQYSTFNWQNDIALVELAQPSNEAKIPLFTGDSHEELPPALIGKMVTAIGWGQADDNSLLYYPERLRQVDFPVVDDRYCNDSYPSPYVPISQGQLCAGESTGKDTCNGDSGGPVVSQIDGTWVHVGITSFGAPCNQYDGWYAVYTRTSAYFNFISQYVPNASFWPSKVSLPWLMLLLDSKTGTR